MTTTQEIKVLKAHLALNVKNVERSLDFYRRMLGIGPSKVRAGYAKFDVENPPLNLTLNEVPFNEQGALSHLGLQVSSTDEVLAMRRKWAEAGLVTRDEMQTNCCYAVQDKTWVSDPDGNEWEVFVVLVDNLTETSMCCVVGESEEPSVVRSLAEAGACATSAPKEAEADASCCGGAAVTAAVEGGANACCAPAAPVTLSR